MTGRVHSIETLGTLDGPGVRFVLFMQGCPLRCACCHNPDTWECEGGVLYTPDEIVKKVTRYRTYFGTDGGITLSGGEPLLQAEFAYEVFRLCRAEGINTCLDTSGCVLNKSVEKLLSVTDRVLLDIKFTNEEDYKRYTEGSFAATLRFFDYLEEKKIKTTVRQVIIPTLTDGEENLRALSDIVRARTAADKVELLPFRKICTVKYDKMGIAFPLADIPEPSKTKIKELEALI